MHLFLQAHGQVTMHIILGASLKPEWEGKTGNTPTTKVHHWSSIPFTMALTPGPTPGKAGGDPRLKGHRLLPEQDNSGDPGCLPV